MAKSDQIKLDIARLTSEARKKETLLQEKRTEAATRRQQIKSGISQFRQQRQKDIENERLRETSDARTKFTDTHTRLQAAIEARAGFTYASWEDSLWSSLNVENKKDRPEYNLTRLGTFMVKGENDELRMPAMFSILGGKNLLLRAKGLGRKKARNILRNVAIRLLASLPPGKMRFTFIDPVELGSTAAGLRGMKNRTFKNSFH